MTAPATTATNKPAARTHTQPTLDRPPARREPASLERRLEADTASAEAASFPEALLGVPFN